MDIDEYLSNIKNYSDKTSKTTLNIIEINNKRIKLYINEFWTSKQRKSNSIHEISYRACFKPQLPNFFITLLTKPNDIVYDPFSGRGTTIIEAALLNRNIISNDINPLSKIFCKPRLFIPNIDEIQKRLNEIEIKNNLQSDIDLSMFFHDNTLKEILSIKNYLINKEKNKINDHVDDWIRMVATNRLTGHSKGFFSIYTLPPNQALLPERQKIINLKRNITPEYRNVKQIILKKSKSLLRNINNIKINELKNIGLNSIFLESDASETKEIKDNIVTLIVTSPPFLDVVHYSNDNWMRLWFNNIDYNEVSKKITFTKNISEWNKKMESVLIELYRVTKPNGYIAFEVGEVKKGKIQLDIEIATIGINIGFECIGIIINKQNFTKTANIWGVSNNEKGTNTNRIVLFKKKNN